MSQENPSYVQSISNRCKRITHILQDLLLPFHINVSVRSVVGLDNGQTRGNVATNLGKIVPY